MASAIENAVTAGRLGVRTLTTAYGVLAAGTTATGPVQNIGTGTAGELLLSSGASSLPTYTDIVASQAQVEAASSTSVYITPGRQKYHPSTAKVYVRWQVSGGTPTIDGSGYNVSSLTDTAVGQVTVNFTTSFSDANYGCASTAAEYASGPMVLILATANTGSALINSKEAFSPFGLVDPTGYVGIACFGDQ